MALSVRSMLQKFFRDGWAETASADNLVATATHAAVAGVQHSIKSVSFSFNIAPTAGVLYQVKVGAVVKWEGFVDNRNGVNIPFPGGITATINELVQVVLAASGTAGTIGKANIHGVTE